MQRPAMTFTRRGVRDGFLRLAPLGLFALAFGLAFGAAAVERGLDVPAALLMSAAVFAGASQFAALDLWAQPLPLLSITVTVLAINARHLLLGAALSPWVNAVPLRHRVPALALMSEPNFADSQGAFRSGYTDVGILLGGGLLLWVAWVLGTAVGAAGGQVIGDLERFGLDLLMASYFAALATNEARGRDRLLPLIVAAAVAVLAVDIAPHGWGIIVAALAGGVVGGLLRAR